MDYLHAHGAVYSRHRGQRAHMRCQVATLEWLRANGFEGRAEFELPMESARQNARRRRRDGGGASAAGSVAEDTSKA